MRIKSLEGLVKNVDSHVYPKKKYVDTVCLEWGRNLY